MVAYSFLVLALREVDALTSPEHKKVKAELVWMYVFGHVRTR